jgi:hypothetical protein
MCSNVEVNSFLNCGSFLEEKNKTAIQGLHVDYLSTIVDYLSTIFFIYLYLYIYIYSVCDIILILKP